ncbi:nitroreductase/quinone reductase family protein [Actinocatenispora rupis]|uniref:Cation-binding protein n=1 Tax=Actinocatenispora rupis TaxID=519421 RepID=A0A8J3JG05_9ACTN|nr:nitroreductase/quinone reductase family protein [Actinocatenispora rupis]GID15238.1 cation-binding protein [Actinocatenispora rupis]
MADAAEFNRGVIAEFRANGGRVGGMFAGADLLLLTTTGARTGRTVTSPVGYLADGPRLLAFASNAGGDTHPGWYHNLLAQPEVTVEVGTERYPAVAVPLRGAERDRWYAAQGERIPAYAEYQRRTARRIPVVALYRVDSERGRAVALHLVRVHAALRAQLAAAVDGGAPVDELAAHCLSFCGALGEHHGAEDATFPRLAAAIDGLAPVLDTLRAEHREVAAALADVRKLAAGGDAAAALARTAGLGVELDEHFGREERELFPRLTSLPANW